MLALVSRRHPLFLHRPLGYSLYCRKNRLLLPPDCEPGEGIDANRMYIYIRFGRGLPIASVDAELNLGYRIFTRRRYVNIHFVARNVCSLGLVICTSGI